MATVFQKGDRIRVADHQQLREGGRRNEIGLTGTVLQTFGHPTSINSYSHVKLDQEKKRLSYYNRHLERYDPILTSQSSWQ